MQRLISQLPLPQRIAALAEAARNVRAMREQNEQAEAELMEELALAEAQVLTKAEGSEGAELSGLIEEGANPHAPGVLPVRDDAQGDAVSPTTGEGSGDTPLAGSDSSPDPEPSPSPRKRSR